MKSNTTSHQQREKVALQVNVARVASIDASSGRRRARVLDHGRISEWTTVIYSWIYSINDYSFQPPYNRFPSNLSTFMRSSGSDYHKNVGKAVKSRGRRASKDSRYQGPQWSAAMSFIERPVTDSGWNHRIKRRPWTVNSNPAVSLHDRSPATTTTRVVDTSKMAMDKLLGAATPMFNVLYANK